MNDKISESFGIGWHFQEDGTKKYYCRGTGDKYKYFYDVWVKFSSYRCVGVDWPWDMFVFDNPKDHERLIRDHPDSVYYNGDDEDE
jgi:hypothetical protein